MGRKVRLTESQLNRVIKEATKRVVSEMDMFGQRADDVARELGRLEGRGNVIGSRSSKEDYAKFDQNQREYNRFRREFNDLVGPDAEDTYTDYPSYKEGRDAYYDYHRNKKSGVREACDFYFDEDEDEFYAEDRRGRRSQEPRKMRRDMDGGGYSKRGRSRY